MSTAELASLFERLRDVTARMDAVRTNARTEAVRVIRLLEGALVRALDGERLRGMQSLAGRDFYATNVRRPMFDAVLPPPNGLGEARETLVLRCDGTLAFAWAGEGRRGVMVGESREATDDELFAEDLERFAIVLVEVLRRHVAACVGTTSRYENLRGLARRVANAVAA